MIQVGKSCPRPRTLGLGRHDRVFPGSDRGFCVTAEGTGSSRRRGMSTNSPIDRVLRSTDGSLDDLIQNPPVRPLPELDNQPKRQADAAVLSSKVRRLLSPSQLLSLVGVESTVSPCFLLSRSPVPPAFPSSCDPSPIPNTGPGTVHLLHGGNKSFALMGAATDRSPVRRAASNRKGEPTMHF
jgi:hypothetical protein